MNDILKQYNSLSFYYNVLYAGYNIQKLENQFLEEQKDILNKLKKNSKILDCACGNGIQATALKRKGYNVIATDLSSEMIKLTKKYSEKNNLEFPIKRMAWEDLPNEFEEEFDLVYCWGNSISHSKGKESRLENIKAMYDVIKKGGKLIIETRNWDNFNNNKDLVKSLDIRTYNKKKYIPVYNWDIKGFDKLSSVKIIFIELLRNGKTKSDDFKLNFYPFRYEDIKEELENVGFKILDDTFNENKGNYYLIVKK